MKTDTTSTKDSCQVIATGNTLQATTAPQQPASQSTVLKASTEITPRRTLEEQKPFIFSFIAIAIIYIGILILNPIIKNRIANRSLREEE